MGQEVLAANGNQLVTPGMNRKVHKLSFCHYIVQMSLPSRSHDWVQVSMSHLLPSVYPTQNVWARIKNWRWKCNLWRNIACSRRSKSPPSRGNFRISNTDRRELDLLAKERSYLQFCRGRSMYSFRRGIFYLIICIFIVILSTWSILIKI